jgi:hypothetical protein
MASCPDGYNLWRRAFHGDFKTLYIKFPSFNSPTLFTGDKRWLRFVSSLNIFSGELSIAEALSRYLYSFYWWKTFKWKSKYIQYLKYLVKMWYCKSECNCLPTWLNKLLGFRFLLKQWTPFALHFELLTNKTKIHRLQVYFIPQSYFDGLLLFLLYYPLP